MSATYPSPKPPQEQKAPTYFCKDDQLMDQLETLFAEGAQDVEIQHPTEGARIITRAQFQAIKADIEKMDGTPAERIRKNAQRERKAKVMQKRLSKSLADCQVIEVDPDGEIGTDIHGNKHEVDGLTFLDASLYPPGITRRENEVGALIDPGLNKAPLRLVTVGA